MSIKLKHSRSQLSFLPEVAEYGLIFYLIAVVTLFTAVFILQYCSVFSEFGMMAKDRLINDPRTTFFITPLFFWLSAYVCRRFASNAAGNSLDNIKSALIQLKKTPNSYNKISPFLNLRMVFVTSISSLLSAFGGGALGREAPSLQMTVSIFTVIANKMRFVSKKISLENWIFAGSAAGFAIAFHAPIAGLIYVTEKMFNHHKTKSFHSNLIWSFFALFVTIFVLREATPLFKTPDIYFEFGLDAITIVFLAMICGISAYSFKRLSIYLYGKFAAIKSNLWHLVPIIAGLVVSIVSFYAGVDSFSGGIATAQEAVTNADAFLTYKEVFGRIFNTMITFISGCAGGLVAPAVAMGAGISSMLSHILEIPNLHMFILSGMVSFLSPILGLPLTAAAVILETSDQSLLIFPFLVFSSLVSITMAHAMSKIKK